MTVAGRTKRALLRAFLLCIAACGALGAFVLIIPRFGPTGGQILMTVLACGVASILAMCGAAAWERATWRPIGPLAMLACGVALIATLALIWDLFLFDNLFSRLTASACVLAAALSHVSLLSLARLRGGDQVVRLGTVTAIGLLVALMLALIWEDSPSHDLLFRFMGVVAIVVVCGTIAVPVLQRMHKIQADESVVTTPLQLQLTCPRCLASLTRPSGRSRCACGLRFNIEIEEERCTGCGYLLYQLAASHCPECGAPVN